MKNIYNEFGRFNPADFKVQYHAANKQATLLLMQVVESVLDAAVKAMQEN